MLQQLELRIVVVFTDVEMPGSKDGFGLSQWVRANRQSIDIVLVGSPARATGAAADLWESGPRLSKPYEPHVALDRIRRLLAARAARK